MYIDVVQFANYELNTVFWDIDLWQVDCEAVPSAVLSNFTKKINVTNGNINRKVMLLIHCKCRGVDDWT